MEQRVAHGRQWKDTCRGAYQIEVFRVSLALWSAASCRTFAGRHGANVRTGQGSGRGLAATKSNRNELPLISLGGSYPRIMTLCNATPGRPRAPGERYSLAKWTTTWTRSVTRILARHTVRAAALAPANRRRRTRFLAIFRGQNGPVNTDIHDGVWRLRPPRSGTLTGGAILRPSIREWVLGVAFVEATFIVVSSCVRKHAAWSWSTTRYS